jgi:hypothetical protein
MIKNSAGQLPKFPITLDYMIETLDYNGYDSEDLVGNETIIFSHTYTNDSNESSDIYFYTYLDSEDEKVCIGELIVQLDHEENKVDVNFVEEILQTLA